jgi:hypothetical protein
MTRTTGFIAVLAALVVLSTVRSATAEPIVIRPTAIGELVDRSPIDGAGLELFLGAENVALGPSAETRVFYEFSLAGVTMKRSEFATFSVTRRQPFSECASLSPCPELNRIDVYGYTGDGAITVADYTGGTLLGSVTEVPLEGRSLKVDVTSFISGLLSEGNAFAGIALRPGSQGGAGFHEPTLNVVPEPSTLVLVATAALGCIGRRQWRRRLERWSDE